MVYERVLRRVVN